jgi:hypothetical protein
MVTTVAVMSTPDALVPLQVQIHKRVRTLLRSIAPRQEVTMSELADVLLDYGLAILESGKIPSALAAAIEKARKAKDAEASD